MITIKEPQLPWLQTAIYHTGLDVKMEVAQCTVRVQCRIVHTNVYEAPRALGKSGDMLRQ